MRLGYFGGSFDPPHRAHLLAASLARQHFALDLVLLAPTGRQPLKTGGAEAPFPDRLRMVELLCESHPGLEASAIDGPRPGGEPNYTVDTLRRLRSSFAGSARLPPAPSAGTLPPGQPGGSGTSAELSNTPQLFAIVGADAFLGLRQWREPGELLRLAQWIVISRPGFAPGSQILQLTPAEKARVHLLSGLDERLSATGLRQRLHAGEDCHAFIPPAVLQYLEDRNLYRG